MPYSVSTKMLPTNLFSSAITEKMKSLCAAPGGKNPSAVWFPLCRLAQQPARPTDINAVVPGRFVHLNVPRKRFGSAEALAAQNLPRNKPNNRCPLVI